VTRRIHVSESAESDLVGIWQYSFEQWGELQADKYLDELDSGIRKLATSAMDPEPPFVPETARAAEGDERTSL
jgi:plasmid stabilization system protein ParE